MRNPMGIQGGIQYTTPIKIREMLVQGWLLPDSFGGRKHHDLEPALEPYADHAKLLGVEIAEIGKVA